MNLRPYASILALSFGFAMFVPIFILGTSIGWPASLDYPAEKILPLILEEKNAVQFGYLSYLLYSFLFLPTIAALGQILGDSYTTRLSLAFAAISSLARSIGILRWLTVMPALAATYNSGTKENIALLYSAINSYGGGIGELLGVSLFGAAAVGLIAWQILHSKSIPSWLGYFGLLAAVGLLLPWLEIFSINLGAIITISVATLQIWFIALGLTLLFSRQQNIQTTNFYQEQK